MSNSKLFSRRAFLKGAAAGAASVAAMGMMGGVVMAEEAPAAETAIKEITWDDILAGCTALLKEILKLF